MKKDLAIIFGLFAFIVVLLIFGRSFTSVGLMNRGATQSAQVTQGKVNVNIKSLSVDAQVAASANDRKKGLSKTESIPLTEGMLFVFDTSGQYGIWMKDMKFAIDILWISEDKKIVDIAQNVAPEPDKKDSDLIVYKPRGSAKYILEVNAGLSALNGIQIGDPANFQL